VRKTVHATIVGLTLGFMKVKYLKTMTLLKHKLQDGSAVFLSDVHLRKPRGISYRNLLSFLRSLDEKVKSLVIVGDLFDFWVGDIKLQETRFAELFGVLDSLVRRGVEIVYCEGNHDFNLGPRITERLKLKVATTDAELHLGAVAIYTAHGDMINPNDIGYRMLRYVFRTFFSRWLIKVLPEIIFVWLANFASRSSRKYTDIRGDNSKEKIYQAFAEQKIASGYDMVVIGHTHRPLKTGLHHENRHGYLVNLGDWMEHFTFLRLDIDGTAQFGPYLESELPDDESTISPEDTVEFKLT
jgi:UDP-2,3-diacylglucosamine hydrolase